MHGAPTEEQVTISAGTVTRHNFTARVVGHTRNDPLRVIRSAPQRWVVEMTVPPYGA
jgi:hypothetical protein